MLIVYKLRKNKLEGKLLRPRREMIDFTLTPFFLQAEVESRKRAVEGTLGGRTFKSFQDLKTYKADNFKEPAFVEEICRGIAVNTKYSSNIQVHYKQFIA